MTCTEFVAQYNVDSAVAAEVVPPDYTLMLNKSGKATLLMATQDCSNIVVNGWLSTGRAGLSHAWIQIGGPYELDPVPGATKTQPTAYWYYVQGQTDNLLLAATMMLSGLQVDVVDRVTLGVADAGTRHGEVVERLHPEVGYSWDETSAPTPMPNLGVNHRLYREQLGPGGHTVVSGKVSCLLQVYGLGTSVLTADSRSLIGKLGFITPLTSLNTKDFTQGCTVEFETKISNPPGR